MNLLNLAPDIQEEILFLNTDTAERRGICEKSIRRLSSVLLWNEQRAHWTVLIPGTRSRTADSDCRHPG
jgi:hypothetical protein